jgi:hypothetical protein
MPIHILGIDHELYNQCDKEALWRELFCMFQRGAEYTILKEDIERLNAATEMYKLSTPEDDLINKKADELTLDYLVNLSLPLMRGSKPENTIDLLNKLTYNSAIERTDGFFGEGLKGNGILSDLVPTQFTKDTAAFITNHKDWMITNMNVARKPIDDGLISLINYMSLGRVKENKDKLHYDQIWHLSLELELSNGTNKKYIRFEKNQTPQIFPLTQLGSGLINVLGKFKNYVKNKLKVTINNALDTDPKTVQVMKVYLREPINFFEFIINGIKRVGENAFFRYSAIQYNCQHFVMNLLLANGINNPQNKKFVAYYKADNQNQSEEVRVEWFLPYFGFFGRGQDSHTAKRVKFLMDNVDKFVSVIERDKVRTFPQDMQVRVLVNQDNKCAVCGDNLLMVDAEADHIVEHSKGGLTEESNCQMLHKDCHKNKTRQFMTKQVEVVE